MKPLTRFGVPLAIAGIGALVLERLSGLPIWAAVAIVVGAMLINGFVAMIEDDLPGGFNNLDGKATPSYIAKLKWLTISVLGTAVALGVIIFLLARQ